MKFLNGLREQRQRHIEQEQALQRAEERKEKQREARERKREELKKKVQELERLDKMPRLNPLKVLRTDAGNFKNFTEYEIKKPRIHYCLGERGMGKSVWGFGKCEDMCKRMGVELYLVSYPQKINLPWIHNVDTVEDVPRGNIAYSDESARAYSARRSSSKTSVDLTGELVIARHKDIHYIFVSQNSALADINISRLVDITYFKCPSVMQVDFERRQLKRRMETIRKDFYELKTNGNKEDYWIAKPDKTNLPKVYIWSNRFYGLCSNGLPTFWTEDISTAYGKGTVQEKPEEDKPKTEEEVEAMFQ